MLFLLEFEAWIIQSET